ncbi:MAG: hypothetical protein LBK99_01075 [Opitutaceae bacterium]|nr:hypothetical protein [Opitutaceae bacterium]
MVRQLLIEAAWRLVRYQPDYPPVKKFLAAANGSRKRRRAIWPLTCGDWPPDAPPPKNPA